jgi:hypothetical protein
MMDEVQLVLAMPRRELFRIQGFVPPTDVAILESLAEESWYAAPSLLATDFDAKEVRLGLVVTKPGQVLLSETGVLLHATCVPPEAARLGSGLASLKHFALAAGRQLLATAGGRIELAGFCNEDALQECRGIFILVYRFQSSDDLPAPQGMGWVAHADLPGVPLDPVSALVLDAVRP